MPCGSRLVGVATLAFTFGIAAKKRENVIYVLIRAPCKGDVFQRVKVPSGRLVVPPGSSRNSRGGNESAEASDVKGSPWAIQQADGP